MWARCATGAVAAAAKQKAKQLRRREQDDFLGHSSVLCGFAESSTSGPQELDKEVEKYFVSSGFAFVHSDSSADVCAVEAVKLDDLDPEAVKAGLAEYNAKLGSLQVAPPPPLPPRPLVSQRSIPSACAAIMQQLPSAAVS